MTAGKRLFFGLELPEQVRLQLVQLQQTLLNDKSVYPPARIRVIPPANLHMTVLFLGQVESAVAADLSQCSLKSAGFELVLDQLGGFSRAKVVWIGATQLLAALAGLYEVLTSQVAAAGLQLEARPLTPHVTLFRHAKLRKPLQHSPVIQWPVSSLSLLESVPSPAGGVQYQALQQWRLPIDADVH